MRHLTQQTTHILVTVRLKCMGVNGEVLQLYAVYTKSCFMLQESVSGTTSHVRLNEVCMIKIIIARKISLIFVAIGIVTHAAHHKNTDCNKLVIFSGMYYGDNYVTVCM